MILISLAIVLYAVEAAILGFIWHRGHWSRVRIADRRGNPAPALKSAQP